MCSGRIDLEFLLRAFANGQDGVFVGGCKLDECNYVTHGNYDALANVYLCRKIMERIGLNPERLHIEFMSGADGGLLVDVTNDFARQVKGLGPIAEGEGIDRQVLNLRIDAARKLVPYIKLVERERLRMPKKEKKAYHEFFTSAEFDRLFDELVGNQLAVSQIMSLLQNKHLSTGEIAEALGLNPSEIAKYISSSSRQGLVRYDEGAKRYALV
jgi:F420-non-reducing hydrogenase iron-sulfur subunit